MNRYLIPPPRYYMALWCAVVGHQWGRHTDLRTDKQWSVCMVCGYRG